MRTVRGVLVVLLLAGGTLLVGCATVAPAGESVPVPAGGSWIPGGSLIEPKDYAKFGIHCVEENDTLDAISLRTITSLKELQQLNPRTDLSRLVPGELILVRDVPGVCLLSEIGSDPAADGFVPVLAVLRTTTR